MIDSKAQYLLDHMVVTQTWPLPAVVKERIGFFIHNFKICFPHIQGEIIREQMLLLFLFFKI